jgi:hypothetical protein
MFIVISPSDELGSGDVVELDSSGDFSCVVFEGMITEWRGVRGPRFKEHVPLRRR